MKVVSTLLGIVCALCVCACLVFGGVYGIASWLALVGCLVLNLVDQKSKKRVQ